MATHEDAQGKCRGTGRFNVRAMVSVAVTASFLVLVVTGLMLYVAPRGRTANWTNWTLLGLGKEQWGAVHMCFACLFVIVGIVHVVYNWRVLTSYFKSRLTRVFAFRAEWVAAVVLCGVIFAGAVWDVPPFGSVAAWNTRMKDYWESQAGRAPIPHGELLTLGELAERAHLPLETALANLKAAGIEVASADVVFGELAGRYNMSPDALFALAAGTAAPAEKGGGGQGQARPQGDGRGMGRMTVRQVCEQEGVDAQEAIAKLKGAGIDATPDTSIRDIVDKTDRRPVEIVNIITK